MIASDNRLRKVCRNYHLVENYMQARFDEEQLWELHHRREIDETKSAQQLIDEGKYFDVDPSELIFLTKSEHSKLHIANLREETKNKMSEAHIGIQSGEKHPMFGKHHSAAAKLKISENNARAMLGKHHSGDAKKKISERTKECMTEEAIQKMIKAKTGMRWWNNGIISRQSRECPGEGFIRGRIRK